MKFNDKKGYLIGPEIFPLYLLVVKIVMIVAVAGTMVGTIADFTFNQGYLGGFLIGTISLMASSLIAGFGWVTLIFAVIERVADEESLKEIQTSIEKEVQKDKSKVEARKTGKASFGKAGVITGLVFTLLLLLVLNNFSQLIGIWSSLDQGSYMPLLDKAAFGAYLPFINALLLLQLLFGISKLVFKNWSYGLAAANLAINALSLALALTILGDGTILSAEFAAAMKDALGEGGGIFLQLQPLVNFLKILFVVVFIADTIEGFYKAFKKNREALDGSLKN